mgnify:CR=1 FL=1
MKTLYLDTFSGASGNMLLGLLIDLGANRELVLKEIAKLNIGKYEIKITRVDKSGIDSTYLGVDYEEFGHGLLNKIKKLTSDSAHFRNLKSILQILENSDLNTEIRSKAEAVFTALAKAEAKVHGKTLHEVHFHEVGAVDTIIDIVGCVIALNSLGIQKVLAGRVQTGRGFIKCAHGLMPIPAPATAELLKTIPNYPGNIEKELITPTGAALLSVLVDEFVDMPDNFAVEKVGYGAGTWDLEIPNVIRGYLGELQANPTTSKDELYVLESNIDDMSPQFYEHVIRQIMAHGANDAWITPIIMKKSRPANTLSVLLKGELLDTITQIILRETTAIGVRYYPVERKIADRSFTQVVLASGHKVNVKYSYYNGELINAMPEYDDCLKVATELNIPLKQVWLEAIKLA